MADLTSRLILSLIDRVTAPARTVSRAVGRLNDAVTNNASAIANTQSQLLGAVGTAVAFGAALATPVRAAMDFESAMADVAKVVDFEGTGLADFRTDLLAMSREIPMTVMELAELAAAGGSAGIEGDELLRYVEQASKMGIAFGITADQAGGFMNSTRAALGMTMDDTLALADAMNFLTNSMAAEAPELVDFMTRVTGDISNFGMTATEAAAIGTAMLSTGAQAEVAATSYRNMGRHLTMGAAATRKQRGAFEELGLTAEDVAKSMQTDSMGTILDVMDRINALPDYAQAAISSEIFGNEARALTPLIANTNLLREALGYVADETKYAGSAYAEYEARSAVFASELTRFRNVLTELSITVGEALLPHLSAMMEQLTPIVRAITAWASENPELVAGIVRVTGALIGLRLAFLGFKLLGLVGKGGVLSLMVLGMRALGPAAAGASRAASQMIALQTALAGMSGIKLSALGKVRAGLAGIAGLVGLGGAASAISAVVAAIAGITAPVWGLVAALVATVAAAGYVLWRSWDRISAVFEGVGLAIANSLRPGLEWIRDTLSTIPVPQALLDFFGRFALAMRRTGQDAIQAFEAVKTWFGSFDFAREILPEEERAAVVAAAQATAQSIIDSFSGMASALYNKGYEAFTMLANGIKDAGAQALQAARDIAKGIADAMESAYGGGGMAADSAPGQSYDANGNPTGFAKGGRMPANRPAIVGEQGPELLFPDRAAFVATARQTRRMMAMANRAGQMTPTPRSSHAGASGSAGASRGSVTLNLGGITVNAGGHLSAREVSQEIGREVGEQLRSSLAGVGI